MRSRNAQFPHVFLTLIGERGGENWRSNSGAAANAESICTGTFKTQLTALRLQSGFSQEEVASKTGISLSRVVDIEQNPSAALSCEIGLLYNVYGERMIEIM